MSRGFKIIRSDFFERERSDRVDWLDSFARKIEQISNHPQTAVEAARSRDQQSIVDMIGSIMNGRQHSNGASTVESVVQDMQERTGLAEYLRRVKSSKDSVEKIAQEVHSEGQKISNDLPDSFSDLPEKTREDVKNYINNLVETHHGNIHVPAVVESVIQTFRLQGVGPKHINEMTFEKYISDQIMSQKQKNPSAEEHNTNLGKGIGIDTNDVDTSNTDMFEGLMPAKS